MKDGEQVMLKRIWKNKINRAALYSALLLAVPNMVQALTLEDIEFSVQSEGRLQLQLNMDGPAFEPKVFRTDNPARIALDFPGVENGLKQKVVPINVGATSGLHVLEAAGRTRVVINLLDQTPFETEVQGNQLLITLQNNKISDDVTGSGIISGETADSDTASADQSITNIDFRRGNQGEGKVLISLTDPNAVVDVQEQGGKVVLYFMNTDLPEHLAKKLDVTDFATPVESVETSNQGNRPKMVITPVNSQYDYLSYQSDGLLTLEFRALTKAERVAMEKKKFAYSGERLSLNFQDIPVRSVLQILADFTDMNIVAADSVKGNVTLRLNNVPWDQALSMILKSKGLGKREEGNVMRIAPVAEINKQEKEELQAIQFKEELEPLKIEFIQVKYAKASDLKKVISGFKDTEALKTSNEGNYISDTGSSSEGSSGLNRSSILSSRGVVNIDERTNLLIVKDTGRNLEAIRRLVRKLDTPVRQVLIEARVVVASNDFTKDLGFKLAANKNFKPNDQSRLVEAGGALANGLLVDLAAASPAGAMGFTLAKIGNYLLDLEISALEKDGKGEVISSPRVITSDKQEAKISQGFEIPYSTTSQNGTNTQFKKAELKLQVTPLITPDDQVQMELTITKDVPLSTQAGAEPALETREITTTVQVGNGETIVLGGVYEGQTTHANKKIPFFGDLPGVGFLFQQNLDIDTRKELLIFITPKILKDDLKTI